MTDDDSSEDVVDLVDQPEASGSRDVMVGAKPPGPHDRQSAETVLQELADLVEGARPMPLSASVMVNKDEVVDLVNEALDNLPEELRAARWLLKERDEFLAKMRVDGDEILEAARARSERMVQRTEVVKAAEHRARRIIEAAEAEARRMRRECEDYCDEKLASFETVLERTLHSVQLGREKLQSTASVRTPPSEPEPDPDAVGFYDQDQ